MAKLISKNEKSDGELCQIIASSITDIVRDSLNPTFRQTYFNTVQVTNSSDAQSALENKLLNMLGVNKSHRNNKTKSSTLSVEDYIASKILRSPDVINPHKYSEMISLIEHLLKIESNSNTKISKIHNYLPTDVLPCILKNIVEPTCDNKKETLKPEGKNGASFVIYDNDGHHLQRPNINNGQWISGPSQNGYSALISPQYEPAEQSIKQASQSEIVFSLLSPCSSTNNLITGSGNDNRDESLPGNSVSESVQIHPDHYDPGIPTNYYSGVNGSPSHLLSPSIFWSDLKDPGVKLALLNPLEASGNVPNKPNCVHQSLESSGEKIPVLRLFKCLSCGKYFKQKAKLKQHERIHTASKPFTCIFCGRTFRLHTIFNIHLRTHIGEKPHTCLQCGKFFKQKACLDQHRKIHQV